MRNLGRPAFQFSSNGLHPTINLHTVLSQHADQYSWPSIGKSQLVGGVFDLSGNGCDVAELYRAAGCAFS